MSFPSRPTDAHQPDAVEISGEAAVPRGRRPSFVGYIFGSIPSQIWAWIVAITVIHFYYRQLVPQDALAFDYLFAFQPDRFLGVLRGESIDLLGDLAPLVTHAFLHANVVHLSTNILAFLLFGPWLFSRLAGGASGFGALWGANISLFVIFLVGAASGAVGLFLSAPGSEQLLVGASGGISAFLGGIFRFALQPAWRPGRPMPPLLPLLSWRVMIPTAIFVFTNLPWSMAALGNAGLAVGQGADMVAWQAHLGGFFAGLLLYPLFERVAHLGRRPGA